MFKSSRRRSEKNKIKAVFELQFQATQVPQLKGKKKLTIAVIPESVGKPSVKQKASIEEGTCTWENPVYETVKLVREPKTGNFKENVYYFIVTTGSSKSGFLGEIALNFAEYAEATQPLLVSLPLNFTNYGVILHIGIHKMQGTEEQRDNENEEKRSKSPDRSLKAQLVDSSSHANNDLDFLSDSDLDISSPDDERNLSFKDPRLESSTIPQEFAPLRWNSVAQKKRQDDEGQTEKQVRQLSNTDWSVGSASDRSMVDYTNSPRENFPKDNSLEAPNDSIEILKKEISVRDRQAELSELELQSLRKLVAKENKRGLELSSQVVRLKDDYAALKTEYEQLKSSKKCNHEVEVRDSSEDTWQQLKREKDLNKKLRLRLYEIEDSNSELILVVSDLNKKLEQKSTEMHHLSSTMKTTQHVDEDASKTSILKMDQEKKDEQEDEPSNKEKDLLKQKITHLYAEIEAYSKVKEELEIQIKELVADYDILKQENHDISSKLSQNQTEHNKLQSEYSNSLVTIEDFKFKVDTLEEQINKQALKFSKSLNTMNELEFQVKSLEKELEKQARDFEDDLEAVTQAKVVQEQRAIRAEEALRKTRWSNATAAERLQDEFKKLSADMASKLDENERLSKKTAAEASDMRMQKSALEDMLQKASRELDLLKQQYTERVQEHSNRIAQQAKQIEQMSQELEAKHNEEGEHRDVRFEMEQLKTEKEELQREFVSAIKKIEVLEEDLSAFRSLKDEKRTLKREKEDLLLQHDELKHCMLQIDLEKETLRKQVLELETKIKKKDEVIINMNRKIQSKGDHAATKGARGGTETNSHTSKLEGGESIVESLKKDMRPTSVFSKQKQVKSGIEAPPNGEHKAPTHETTHTSDVTKLASEVASLKQKNQHMEGELNEMHDKYSEISLKFAEVEGERQQLVMSLRNLKNGKKK